MTIRNRLFWTLLILTALLILIGFFGLRAAWDVRHSFELVSDETLPLVQELEDIRFGALRALTSAVEYSFIVTNEGEEEEAQLELLQVAEGKAKSEESLVRYLALVERFFPGEQTPAQDLRGSSEALLTGIDAFADLAASDTPLAALLEEKEELEDLELAFLASFQQVLDHERDVLDQRRQAVSATIATGQRNVALLALLGLAVASALAINLFSLFSRATAKLTTGAKKFGSGDLKWRIDLEGKHELATLGQVLDTMADDLQRTTVSSTFLTGLLESMLDGLIVLKPDCTVKMVNRALLVLLGREEKEVLGKPVDGLFADARFNSLSRIDAFVQAGLIGQQTTTLATRDGEEIPVILSSSLVLRGDAIDGIVCLAQDQRGRLKLQQEILHQRDLLKSTLRSIGDGVIATDAKARVTFLNPVAENLTGWPQDDAKGRDIVEIFKISNERTGAVAKNPVHQVLKEGITVGLANHTVLTARDGRCFAIDDSGAPIRDQDGELQGVILVFRDVSERRKMDQELVAAKLTAEQANQTKSEFLAMMSHEIRTPLNGIIGICRLLLDTTHLGAQEREYAETIRLSGDTLMALIEDILDFSKIETGNVELERSAFDLLQCVEDALDIVAPQALEQDLALHYQLDPELPAIIVGDAKRLRQVLINLVGNAIKFTHEGEVSVWVTSHQEELETAEGKSEEKLLFAVKDTGIGVPPESAERIFEPFAQVDLSRTRKYGGTGLGLSISKRLVELMGGRLWLESGTTTGATFFFTIAMPTPRLRSPRKPKPEILAGKRCLIVSDNAMQLSVISSLCLAWNLLPSTSSTEQETRSLLARQPPNVTIIDLDSTAIDGVSLCQAIHPQAPIIALASPSGTEGDEVQEWVAAKLSKPLKHSTLIRTLTRVFEGRTDTAPPPEHEAPDNTDLAAKLPLRILVAEDDFTNRKVAAAILQSLGYEAEFVDNGSKAVEAVQKERYDLVFMDVRMPEMDGLEATRRIIQTLGPEQPKIIAMTASALKDDRKLCLAAGMIDYISKPVLPHVMRETILRWCADGEPKANTNAEAPQRLNPPSPSPASPLEEEVVAQLRQIGAFPTLARVFLEREPERLGKIRQAYGDDDWQQLVELIHPVTGTAGAVGAYRLSELCRKVEKEAREGEAVSACRTSFEAFENEFQRVREALEATLGEA